LYSAIKPEVEHLYSALGSQSAGHMVNSSSRPCDELIVSRVDHVTSWLASARHTTPLMRNVL